MNLQEHMSILYRYQELLYELRALKSAAPDTSWLMTTTLRNMHGDYNPMIPLPTNLAADLLEEYISGLDVRVKELAKTLGIDEE